MLVHDCASHRKRSQDYSRQHLAYANHYFGRRLFSLVMLVSVALATYAAVQGDAHG
jgi:hypothetical protein